MKKILLIDDSKIFLKLLTKTLENDFQIIGTASNGFDGIELYKTLQPDLVLLDITMPNCNGKECLELIKKYDPHAQVIMCSSLGDEQTVQQCKDLGALGFISKDLVKVDANHQCPALVESVKQSLNYTTTNELVAA